MNKNAIRWITFAISIIALVGFVIVYCILLLEEWSQEPEPPFQFLASSLAGLVGGIVAAAFGQPPPKGIENESYFRKKLYAVSDFLIPFPDKRYREILAAIYAVVYIGMSIWAIVVWAGNDPKLPSLTKNLAVGSMGLFIAIVTAYFKTKD